MADGLVLVDTDVFIWLNRGKAEAKRYAPFVEGQQRVLSFASVAELWLGAHIYGYGEKSRKRLEADIGTTVVVPPTRKLTLEWARLVAEAGDMRPGHPLGQRAQSHDAWVAATGLHQSLPLLTANVKHFEGLEGLELVGPSSNS